MGARPFWNEPFCIMVLTAVGGAAVAAKLRVAVEALLGETQGIAGEG